MRRLLSWVGAAALAACSMAAQADARPAAGAVDSTLPREVALARFRTGLDSVAGLSGGAASKEELIRRFLTALEHRDTAALRDLVMTKAEFAWLYYPTTAQGLPPYDLAPALLWFLTESRGRIGISRALADRGGNPAALVDWNCGATPATEGLNRIWGPCLVVRRLENGRLARERLFGPIIEREGRFKFVDYANKLD